MDMFKEKAGIGRLKEVVIGDNYDAAAFNADVNIDMNEDKGGHKITVEIDLAKRLNWKRSKTEIEMANLEPERMKSKDMANLEEYDEENMFSNIDLANNPLSNDSGNMIQQLKIGNSAMMNGSSHSINNNNGAINRSPSYQGNAIRLEDLPNLPDNDDEDEIKIDGNNHSYASSVHTLAIKSQIQKPQRINHQNGESQQVLISMQNNHSSHIQKSPSVSNKKYVIRNSAGNFPKNIAIFLNLRNEDNIYEHI